MKTKKTNVVNLNNKSRKGMYVYIVDEDNKQHYYKYQPGTQLDEYTKIEPRKRTKKPQPKEIKVDIKPKKKIPIKRNLKSGMTSAYLTNPQIASELDIKKTYRNLLQPLVRSEQLLNVLTEDTNIQKIKENFEYQIRVTGDRNHELAEFTSIGKKTLREVVNDINKIIPNTTKIDKYGIASQRMKNEGYSYEHKEDGTVHNRTIKVIFRFG